MKNFFIAFVSLSLVMFVLFLFSGCTSAQSNESLISDIRYGIFDGECEEYNVNFIYGLREKPYYPDGVANQKVEFGIISVIFAEKIDDGDTVYYTLKINGNITSGTLEKSPYTDQYMADIGKVCSDTDSLILEIYTESDLNAKSVNLENKNLEWEINYEDAFKNGISAMSEDIKELKEAKLYYEIQVKILTEQKTNFGEYFWSVSIIASNGEKHNTVFSPNSTDILVKN